LSQQFSSFLLSLLSFLLFILSFLPVFFHFFLPSFRSFPYLSLKIKLFIYLFLPADLLRKRLVFRRFLLRDPARAMTGVQ